MIALLILPLLLGTVAAKSNSSGVHKRPSRAEVQKGFILHVEVHSPFIIKRNIRTIKTRNVNYKSDWRIISIFQNVNKKLFILSY